MKMCEALWEELTETSEAQVLWLVEDFNYISWQKEFISLQTLLHLYDIGSSQFLLDSEDSERK